jgi:23S rRNA (cytidine1920-2'-O)/16S rRNA (cytidine1409-2'-O)-methyltransferase
LTTFPLTLLGCGVQTSGATSVALLIASSTAARRASLPLILAAVSSLHAEPPEGGVDLVVIDLAWTPQRLAVPAALKWLAPGGRILSLIKPHYEVTPEQKQLLEQGFLPHEHAHTVHTRVLEDMPSHGARVLGTVQSPLVGGKTARRKGVPGNLEFLALLEPCSKRDLE